MQKVQQGRHEGQNSDSNKDKNDDDGDSIYGSEYRLKNAFSPGQIHGDL